MNRPCDDRESLLRQLSAFHASSALEAESIDRINDLVLRSPHAAARDHFDPGHLTGSAWVVNQPGTKVLLVRHVKLNRWLQPGGHADGDFNLARVALREVQEETGLSKLVPLSDEIYDVDIHVIPARGAEPKHLHFDVRYAFVADEQEPLILSDESSAIAWVMLSELERCTTEESIARMYRRWKHLGHRSE